MTKYGQKEEEVVVEVVNILKDNLASICEELAQE